MFERLTAESQEDVPLRFVFLSGGGGWEWEARHRMMPVSLGDSTTQHSLMDFPLRPSLAPLEAYKDRMIMAEPFHNPFGQFLHGSWKAAYSVMPTLGEYERGAGTGMRHGGVTLDRYVAHQLGMDDAVSSLALAYGSTNGNSANGIDEPYVAKHPERAYRDIFGVLASNTGPEEAQARLRQRRSVLDLVRSDVTRVRAALPASERGKLDQYTSSMRSVEDQLARLLGSALECTTDKPFSEVPLQVNLTPLKTDIFRANLALTAQAFRCGITRVSYIEIANLQSLWPSKLGVPTRLHDLHHEEDHEALSSFEANTSGAVADFLTDLANTPEGDGTLLDNTVVVWCDNSGGKHHFGFHTHPGIIIGDGRGRLNTGQYIAYPTHEVDNEGTQVTAGTRCISDFYVTALRAMGLEDETFGDPSVNGGPLEELLT